MDKKKSNSVPSLLEDIKSIEKKQLNSVKEIQEKQVYLESNIKNLYSQQMYYDRAILWGLAFIFGVLLVRLMSIAKNQRRFW